MILDTESTRYKIDYIDKFYILQSSYGKWYNKKWKTVYKTTNKTLFRKRISELLV